MKPTSEHRRHSCRACPSGQPLPWIPSSVPRRTHKHLPELAAGAESMQVRRALDLEILHRGSTVRKLRTDADPNDTVQLNRLLTDAVLRLGGDENSVREYEMNVRSADSGVLFHTYVAT